MIENIDFENDDSIMNVIENIEKSDIFCGLNEDGDQIVISVEKNNGIRVSTYQKNGWIRINDYDLRLDENADKEIVRSESYEK